MSHSLHIILRCNTWLDLPAPPPIPGTVPTTRRRRCPAFLIASHGMDIAQAREMAKDKGWSFKRGQPYEHVDATDWCPDHAAQDAT